MYLHIKNMSGANNAHNNYYTLLYPVCKLCILPIHPFVHLPLLIGVQYTRQSAGK